MDVLKKRKIQVPVDSRETFQPRGVHFMWLGQSGFLFSVDGTLVLVDAYLSNYLEHNHGNLPYAHDRMIPAPIADILLPDIDLVVVTHGHEDHLDPGLMEQLGRCNVKAVFAVPPGCIESLGNCGISNDRIRSVSPETPFAFNGSIRIESFPAAHPQPNFDAAKVWALSYRFSFADKTILFAGDTTIFRRWSVWASARPCDLFVLPVNGRDPVKESRGIVGNMDFHEALIISQSLATPLLGTHFGMFAFNTIDEAMAQEEIDRFGLEQKVELTKIGVMYSMI